MKDKSRLYKRSNPHRTIPGAWMREFAMHEQARSRKYIVEVKARRKMFVFSVMAYGQENALEQARTRAMELGGDLKFVSLRGKRIWGAA